MAREVSAGTENLEVASHAFTSDTVTIMFWCKSIEDVFNEPMYSHWLTWACFNRFSVADRWQLLLRDGASNKNATATIAHNDDVWHCFVGRGNGSNALFDSDLESVTGDALTALDDTTDTSKVNGYNTGGNGPGSGAYFYAVVWTDSLSDNEVAAITRGANPFPIRHNTKDEFIPMNSNDDNVDWGPNHLTVTETGTFVKFAGNPPVQLLQMYMP